MKEVVTHHNMEYIPTLPPKTKQNGSTTFTQITADDSNINVNEFTNRNMESLSSMHSLVLNSKTPSTTVYVAATQSEQPASKPSTDALNGPHVVTIRINTDADKQKAPKISSVHLKSDIDFDSLKINEFCKKNSSLVRLNVDNSTPKILESEEHKPEKAPFIYCNSFTSMTNMVMSSGQCSPSDTLDSGTCSDLDGTPPPLPKKKTSKSNSTKKVVSVTMIRNESGHSELDYEDNDSNISCDSLNSSELNGSVHTEESHHDYNKKNNKNSEPPVAPAMPVFIKSKTKDSFLPQGLLQDIRDLSAKLSAFETESEKSEHEDASLNINENANITNESAQLTSFRLVSQLNSQPKNVTESLPNLCSKTSLISESTYEDRKQQDKMKQEQMCYSSHYFDTDKYYDFHLNEKEFDDDKTIKSVNLSKSDSVVNEVEFFAGVKDYKNEELPSTIRSSKGTIRGVKNRVRAGIATFLQIQNTTKVIIMMYLDYRVVFVSLCTYRF